MPRQPRRSKLQFFFRWLRILLTHRWCSRLTRGAICTMMISHSAVTHQMPGDCASTILHYCDVIMGSIAYLITSLTNVYSTVHSGADQRKHQSSASLAFVWGIHQRPVNSPHKWPVTRKMFPFDDVIIVWNHLAKMSNFLKHPTYWLITVTSQWTQWRLKSIHRGPVNSPHKWPVTRKTLPFDDVIREKYCRIVSLMTKRIVIHG